MMSSFSLKLYIHLMVRLLGHLERVNSALSSLLVTAVNGICITEYPWYVYNFNCALNHVRHTWPDTKCDAEANDSCLEPWIII